MKFFVLLCLVLMVAQPASASSYCESREVDGAAYSICRLTTVNKDIRVFLTDENGKTLGSFTALKFYVESQGLTLQFAMNGGMYHKDRRPVGLYIEDGVEIQRLHAKPGPGNFSLLPNGVFYRIGNRYGVVNSEQYKTLKFIPEFATQSGPMLVIDGALHPKFLKRSKSKKIRNGVGMTRDGQVLYFVMSEQPVTFHRFASLFKDHLDTPNALYLDGTISRIYDAKSGRNDPGLRMGPIIGLVAPAAAD